MPFLTVGGNTVPVEQGSVTHEIEETGSRERMFDASMLETVRARKQVITMNTQLVTRALAETYRGYLLATPPVACNGDLFNNVATNCFIRYQGMTPQGIPGGAKWRVRFTLMEA